MARSERPKSTGTRRTASDARSTRSSASSRSKGGAGRRSGHVVCVQNDGYRASLERRKIYVTLVDHEAEKLGMGRVVDESGEDYLYPRGFFAGIKLSAHLAKTLASAT